MNINVSKDRQEFVRSLVEGGHFASEDAVIDEALELLKERYDEPAKLEELRRQVAVGIEQAERGELALFDPHATLARVRARRAENPGSSS